MTVTQRRQTPPFVPSDDMSAVADCRLGTHAAKAAFEAMLTRSCF